MKTIAITSGGFDPIHIGHVKYLKEAGRLADYVLVIVNNDNWLKKKKGYVFMPEMERVELLQNIFENYVVTLSGHEENPTDMSINPQLKLIKEDLGNEVELILVNGGDRTSENIPEKQLCEELGIKMMFGVGGRKIQSSSELVRNARENIRKV